MSEVRPRSVAGYEGATEDFSRVIIQGEDETGIMFSGPPGMRGTIVLPEFANSPDLPAAPRFGSTFGCGDQMGKMLSHIGGYCSTGAPELKFANQFICEQ